MVNNSQNNTPTDVALLLDLSKAVNSAQACQLADEFTARLSDSPAGSLVDINAGDLLLTRGVVTKIRQQIQRAGGAVGILYATLQQTQQAALDEGLFVKEKLAEGWAPKRQALPIQAKSGASKPISPTIEPATTPSTSPIGKSIELPDFSQPKSPQEEPAPIETVLPPAPDATEAVEVEYEEVLDLTLETEQVELSTVEVIETHHPAIPDVITLQTATDTLYLRQTLRSGQTVRYNGNIVIVGDVHAGGEITAGGDILVWGELRGIAHAGAQGNYKSEIRAMKIEALQLRIADYIARRPDRIYYHREESANGLSPEVARVADAEIKIFKTLLPKN